MMAIREVAISVCNHAPVNGKPRCREGDIVACRRPGGGIGAKEGKDFLWLRIESAAPGFFDNLTRAQTDPADADDTDPRTIIVAKRRFCIPLDRLASVLSGFDTVKARDRDRQYQPFFVMDAQRRFVSPAHSVLPASGLIYDKSSKAYV